MAKRFDVKERILEKSVDLFYRFGFVKASIRDIVKAVGITNSTAYLYFKNKDDILFNIVFNIAAELFTELQTLIEKQNDPIECLQAMIIRQICFTTQKDNLKKARISLEERYQLPPHLLKKALKLHRQIYDLYYSKVCEIERKGLLNEKVDKTVITFGIFAMMNWVYRWFETTGRLSVEEIAESIIDMFFRGILKKKDEERVYDERSASLN